MFPVFEASSEDLSGRAFSLKAGQTWKIAFDLDLHLAPGTYHLGAWIWRHDIEKAYDTLFPAATLYVTADRPMRGAANLYPKIAAMDP